jgi:hypothetical protein
MYNPILDKEPSEYKGYLIRSDFRIGIMMCLALKDEELNEYEKLQAAAGLLFGRGAPQEIETLVDGIKWFLTMDAPESSNQKENQEVVSDYNHDSTTITTAFRKVYSIDLKSAKMHWWEFKSLIEDLDECKYTNTIKIRTKDLNTCSNAEERAHYIKAKELVKLPTTLTKEEKEKLELFEKLCNGE